jgi:hypothetical protein
MPASSIKLRLYLSSKQAFVFGNWNYSDQMFRNHSVEYLHLRYFDRRAWLAKNHQSQAYLNWKQDIKGGFREDENIQCGSSQQGS